MNLLHSESLRAVLFALPLLAPSGESLAQKVSSDGNVVVQLTPETVEPLASFPSALIRQGQNDRTFRPTRIEIFQNPVGGVLVMNKNINLWPSETNSVSGGAQNYAEYGVARKTMGPMTKEEAFFSKVFPRLDDPLAKNQYRLTWVQVVETNDGGPSPFIDPYKKDSRASSIIDTYPFYYDLDAIICGKPQEKFIFFDQPRRELRLVTAARPHVWWRAKLYPVLVNCDSGHDMGAITAIDNGKRWGFEMRKAPVGSTTGVWKSAACRGGFGINACWGDTTGTVQYVSGFGNTTGWLAAYRGLSFDTSVEQEFLLNQLTIHSASATGPRALTREVRPPRERC